MHAHTTRQARLTPPATAVPEMETIMKAITRRPGAGAPPPARQPLRWGGRLVSVAAGVLLASGAVLPPADAGTGDLTYAGCIGDLAGCTPTSPVGALDGATAVAVTPSGSDLYAASYNGDDVSHFRIGSNGDLIFAGCIGSLPGCTSITANALSGADGLAVTPAGTDLYAAARLGNVIDHFKIDSSGNLIFAGCIGNLAGCTPITANALAGAHGVVVTPGGKDLYAAAATGNVLDHFQIGADGGLIYAGCIGDLTGCTPTVPRTALDGATGVAVNPAGPDLYATSLHGNVVSRFRIGSDGGLIFAGCTGDHRKCTATTPKTALDGANGVAVTTTSGAPQAYVSSAFAGVVSHFQIGANGGLIFAGCIGGLAGCTQITPNVLGDAAGLAVIGGTHLYAAAFTGNAVSHFAIARFSAAHRRAHSSARSGG